MCNAWRPQLNQIHPIPSPQHKTHKKHKQYVPIAMVYALIRWAMGKLDTASLYYPWKVRVPLPPPVSVRRRTH